MGRQVACDSTPPVYLGTKQLQELGRLRVVDEGRRSARVYLAGDISPVMVNAIAEKLALAGVTGMTLLNYLPLSNRLITQWLTFTPHAPGLIWPQCKN